MKKEARPKERKVPPLKKYLFWLILALLIILSYFILQPYIIAIISAFIISFLIKPLFSILEKHLPKHLAAILCVLIIITFLLTTITLIVSNIMVQATNLLSFQTLDNSLSQLSHQPQIQKLGIDLNSFKEKLIEFFISLLSSTFQYLPSIIITLSIIIIGVYFILINWSALHQRLKDYIPLKNKEKIMAEIGKISRAIIYGSILIGLIEFVFSAIAFYFLGINYYLLLPSLIFFSAFIPGPGSMMIWIPLAIYYIYTKNYLLFTGVLLTGIILSFAVETLLRFKIIGDKSGINIFVMILGILGGVPLFGLFGFVIGPLVLFYTLRILKESLS